MSLFDKKDIDIAWCAGCGDFLILKTLKDALVELEISPEKLVLTSGIGQAAKTPHYLNTNFYNGLHGRSLPPATAIKAVNNELTVIAVSGDGCMYGEGGNHFIHTLRRNPNITIIVCNNMVYGLTKGQASPSSPLGMITKIQPHGVTSEPFNPIVVSIAVGATFVARANCQDQAQTKEIIKKAIKHKGCSIVDIFQPCVTFNKLNTYAWFKENTYYLEETFEPNNKLKAIERAIETEKLPLGIFYIDSTKLSFEETEANKNKCATPFYKNKNDRKDRLKSIMQGYY